MEQTTAIAQNLFAQLQPYPWLQALIVITIFLILAKIADIVITRLISKITARTSNAFDDRFVSLIHRPVFATVALIGVIVAIRFLQLEDQIVTVCTAIVKTILIFVWLSFALNLSHLILTSMRDQRDRFEFVQPTTEPLLRNSLSVLIFLAGVYSIMVAWDINVTGLLASAGIVGLALSFAAQDTLSNLFAGVAILADKPYQIGDFIIIDSGERGKVTHIGLRSTRILTRSDVEISIPNSVMGSAKIVNEAGGPPRRYRIVASVGVAYSSDIDKVIQILEGIAIDNEGVLSDPAPRARFRLFGESSLDFELLCWINDPAKRGLAIHEINCAIFKRFAAEGIEIPFPQRDLHVKAMPQTG